MTQEVPSHACVRSTEGVVQIHDHAHRPLDIARAAVHHEVDGRICVWKDVCMRVGNSNIAAIGDYGGGSGHRELQI